MIKAEVKSTISFPREFINQDDLFSIGEKIFVPLLVKGIKTGVGVDGAPFPPPVSREKDLLKVSKRIFTKKGNIKASSIKQIEKTGLTGFSKRILEDTGRLVSSFRVRRAGKYNVSVSNVRTTDSGDSLPEILQILGVRHRKGKKFYHFIGITKGMEADAMAYANDKINKVCNKFNGK